MEPYTLPNGFAPAESDNKQHSSPSSKLVHTPEPNSRKRSFDQLQQSPDLKINLSKNMQPNVEKIMSAKWRASELKKALPPIKGNAELLPTAFREDPMRAASTFKRRPPIKHHNYTPLTSKRSRIANINLEEFLRDDKVWNTLSYNQQKAIIDRSGMQYRTDIEPFENGKLPNIWKLMTDRPNVKYMQLEKVVDKFQGELRGGVLNLEWRADAKRAGVRRARGDFVREYVEEEEEESSSSGESSDDSMGYDSEIGDMEIDIDDSETMGQRKIPAKLKIKIHED